MSEKKGIKNVKELMILGLQLGVVGKLAMEDGKLSVGDLGLVVQVFPHVVPAFKDLGEVPAELADLDADESTELLVEAARQLPYITDNKRLMNIVVKSIKVALSIGELGAAILDEDGKE